jgi:hypothetical protein
MRDMKKQTYKLDSKESREHIINAVLNAPTGFLVIIQPDTRTLQQNALFHAVCGDVAKQAEFLNRRLNLHQWKVLFISGHAMATGLGADVVPGLEGEFVNIRESSAQMGVKRMTSLIEYTHAYCAGNDIRLKECRYGDE